jgi:hypothetical protein
MMRALTPIFSRPQVLACTTLSEVLPLDLLVLHVQVKGWGWLEIAGGEGFRLRQFFRADGTLQVAVPVRAVLTLKVGNVWGNHRYPIDTATVRDEIWRAPDDMQPAYAQVDLSAVPLPRPLQPAGLVSQVPGFKLRAAPATLTPPELTLQPLPSMQSPLTAPSRPALPEGALHVPIEDLESRMARARIPR